MEKRNFESWSLIIPTEFEWVFVCGRVITSYSRVVTKPRDLIYQIISPKPNEKKNLFSKYQKDDFDGRKPETDNNAIDDVTKKKRTTLTSSITYAICSI